jgi:hypothetical protein
LPASSGLAVEPCLAGSPAATALGPRLVGADLAGAGGLDGEPELFLQGPGDGAPNRMVLPAGGGGDLLDRGPLGAPEHLDHERLLGAGARDGLRRRCSLGRLPLGLSLGRRGCTVGSGRRGRALDRLEPGLGRRRARVGLSRGSVAAGVLRLDADRLEAGGGDAERRRVVAARVPRWSIRPLALRLPRTLSTAPPLTFSVLGGSGRTAPSSRCAAVLRMTA